MAASLLLGDCLELLEDVEDKSVDMVLCDLPYGTTRCKWDTPIDLVALWKAYDRVCKPSAAICLFAQTPFDKVLGCSNLPDLRYEWIWEKGEATGHLNSNKMPLKAHENVLIFYKQLPTYNPQKTSGHERKQSKKTTDSTELYGKQGVGLQMEYNSTDRFPRSVQKFSKDKQSINLHPTQKPLALCEYLIKTYTNEGETILDNCFGSGTTGLAAINTGRNFIGMEKDETFYNLAKARLGLAQ